MESDKIAKILGDIKIKGKASKNAKRGNNIMERDALYWRYYYRFQSLLARDINYMEMTKETEPVVGNGVRKESSLPFILNDLAHDMARLQCNPKEWIVIANFSLNKWNTLKDHPWINEIKEHSEKILTIKLTDKKSYHNQVNKLPKDLRAFIYDKIAADNYYLVSRGNIMVGGFTTKANGEFNGLFSLVKGIGKELFKLGLKQARIDMSTDVKEFFIFCIGDKLKELYETFGFKVDEVIEWDDNQAPKNWDYEKFGKPDLYNMTKSVMIG